MQPLIRASIAEMVGTFMLTFAGAGAMIATSGENLVAIALAYGLAVSMAVYASGHISGGHINPAVTVCMLVLRKIDAPRAASYVVSQLLGATLAAWVLLGTFPETLLLKTRVGATLGQLSKPELAFTVLAIEAVLTFLLLTTIFAVAVDRRGPKNIYGFAIGLTVAFDYLCAGPLTGASMNPARSFGPALIAGDHWSIHWVYWAGPLLGACAGGFVYDTFLIPLAEKEAG